MNKEHSTAEDKADKVIGEIVEVINREYLTKDELDLVCSQIESLVQQLKQA
jgi:hypothetical protein